MARRRSSRSRRRKAQNKPATISTPSPVRAPSPAKVTVRRRVVDPASLGPGRRVSDLPSVSTLRRKAVQPDKSARDAVSVPDVSVSPRKRQVSINGNVAAYRSAQLDRKPGSASAKLWRDNASKEARDNRPDEKRPFECKQRPERVAKPLKAGAGSAPPVFIEWCK